MVRIIPLGSSGSEKSFRVTVGKWSSIVIYDLKKDVGNCNHCEWNPNACEHVQAIETHLEIQENTFNWMEKIAWVLNYQDGKFPYRYESRYYALWSALTSGFIGQTTQRRYSVKTIIKMMRIVNNKINSMPIEAIGYLTLMHLPPELEGLGITEKWYEGKEWILDSDAFWIYMDTGEFVLDRTTLQPSVA